MSGASGAAIRVRDAVSADLAAVREIYAHHVRHGLASFEETPPDLAEIARRFDAIRARGLPYLVAEAAAQAGPAVVRGYAYAGPYRTRPAYRYMVENSVYIAQGWAGRGLGRVLLQTLIDRCAGLGLRQMVAVIGDSDNLASIRLHEALDFRHTGTLHAVGYKFGRWVDCVIMQRPLGDGSETRPED
jgi:phosphinothricin acetyltransferase